MESAKRSHTSLANKPEWHVLVLYTGGTIGMVRNEQGGECTNTYTHTHTNVVKEKL